MQRYFVTQRNEEHLILETSDLHHIKDVMRNKVNDKIECVFQEKVYLCEIENINSNSVKIIEEIKEEHELSFDVTIAIGLVKEQKMDLILQKLTELGISKIIPLKMERSIIKIEKSKYQKKKERWIKICKEAAEQSKRNKIPEVMEAISISQLKDYQFDKKYICSLRENSKLDEKELQKNHETSKIIFVIGPEGGISPQEEELLESLGYTPISLGNRVMRVETAAIYIASIMNFCSKR